MLFTIKENNLILKIDHDGERESLQEFLDSGEIETDKAMCEFFESILANCEWEWINPQDICALTDAPILGRRAEDSEEIVEAYGWMDYAITALLTQLYDYGEAILIGGE